MKLTDIFNISDAREKSLNKLNIFTCEDLIRHFPKGYLDLTKSSKLKDAYHNDYVLTKATVVDIPTAFSTSRVRIVKVGCEQDGECFSITWFNQPYVLQKLQVGVEYLFYGRVQNKYGMVSMVNPTFEELEKNKKLKGIVPVYSITGALTQRIMKTAIVDSIIKLRVRSAIPEEIEREQRLLPLSLAYKMVHSPESFDEIRRGSDRIALEEYYTLMCAFAFTKGSSQSRREHFYSYDAKKMREFSQRFGFEFTGGQKQSINEIVADMTGETTLNRLLQGDVGSGKTAVAFCAMFLAVSSGYQGVMLAPTEVLAEQNYNLLKKYFPEYKVEFLSGSLTKKAKNVLKDRLKNGDIDILAGTHALIQEDVVFDNLALCICDEQHRFGVAQRSSLVNKGVLPDVLVMSATPIPRTLSLIFYGDLNISTIHDKPKQRTEIKTGIVPAHKYDDMLTFIEKEVKNGRQAYFVCPKIDDDEDSEIMSVKELFEDLQKQMKVRFSLLHGKMKNDEKTEIMNAFKRGESDCLVSTTVIEVGIDVPNATIMVIYNAERFGLSQLHQLRGRVGRGDKQSYCFLLSGKNSEKAEERLKIMRDYSDGFKIAELDYDMRGGGDFLGVRQSGKTFKGVSKLKYSASTIFYAKELCDKTLNYNVDLEFTKKCAMEKYESLKDIVLN